MPLYFSAKVSILLYENLSIYLYQKMTVQSYSLHPDKQIEYIGPCEDIIHAGGALHCVTWNIQVDPAPITLEEA